MTTDSVEQALRHALIELGISPELMTPEASMRDDLELDSTEMVQLSQEVSRALGVGVRLDARADLTVREACALIRAALVSTSA